MKQVASYMMCVQPGDFYWRVAESSDSGMTHRPPKDGERPTHMWFKCDQWRMHCIPIKPEKNENNNASWDWDGDLDKPTISPSIKSSDGNRILWHGHIVKGELKPCTDSPIPMAQPGSSP